MTDPEQSQSNLELPTVSEIDAAYQQTIEHNDAHSGFGVGFGALIKMMMQHPEIIGDDEQNQKAGEAREEVLKQISEETKTEGQIDAAVLDLMNENLFAKVGVKIFPSGGDSGGLTMRNLKPHLIPYAGGAYAEYLATVEKPETSTTNKLLTDIDTSTFSEVREAVTDESLFATKEVQDVFIASRLQEFVGAADEYERIGVESKTTELVKRWGQDILPEYFDADKMYLLGDFAHVWHLDGTRYNWKDAIPFIAKLEEEDRTKEFAQEIKDNLVKVVGRSIKDLDTDESQAYAKGARPSLVEIGKLLRGEEYDAAIIMDRWQKPAY
ncbi:MAG: hypothetical protein WAW80_05280 [Candidatus Saccharimonadales bacterium]